MASSITGSNGETLLHDESVRESLWIRRLSTAVGDISKCSAEKDENYYGSKFIEIWERKFIEENGEITFDSIYHAVITGLEQEGQIDPDGWEQMAEIMRKLNEVRRSTAGKRNKRKMKNLQRCCLEVYTMESYVYRVVNKALRENDQNKLMTVGPFCYLLFNYIGRRHNDYSSIRRLFRRAIRSTEGGSKTVYRGDLISDELIEDFREAMEDKPICFKWQSFVSTSLDDKTAKEFGDKKNALYVIELDHRSAKDQCVDVTKNARFKREREVLLRPGVRFQVTKMEFDDSLQRHVINVRILPSLISLLQ